MKKQIRCHLWKDGKKRALTFSYDDGRVYDRNLVAILNRYGLRGTFHLNSGKLGLEGYVTPEEIQTLYAGHEVSCHTVTHPFLDRVPQGELVNEVLEDRRGLEGLAGYPVRGMSYPFGTTNDTVVSTLRSLGIVYSRTTKATDAFTLPEDFLRWHPTCHHKQDLMGRIRPFEKARPLALFYVWGHSYEFPRDNGWEGFESFCAAMAEMPDVWYATNIEIYEYVTALRALQTSVDGDMIYNPSATDVWLLVDGETVVCRGGETTHIG